ncbi:MAG: iron ABC transporter permease [Clostridia bacterium]|nr:iron ABC transporter permease [Clostridia bacterium]MBR0444132.1 iron ABC transporter permease [Clostridia bacterium]
MAKKGWKHPPMTKERLKNQFNSLIGNPFNVIVFITLILLFVLIIIPLLSMVHNTFIVAKSELRNIPGAKVGDYTLWYWKYLIASPLTKTILWVPLRNSLIIGAFVTVIAVPLGALMAWLMVRTDIPGKGLLSALILIPYMIPSWCKALSWMTIFRNPSMGGNGVLSSLGIPVPNALASGFIPIIIVMTMHYYAFSYIMASGALRSINSELEEMGEIQGATRAQILKSITLPLILPSILSATIMTISKSVGTYGVAARLGGNNADGTPFYVLATRMKDFINSSPKGVGYAMSILMILLAAGTIIINQKLIGTRKSYATIGGKGTRSNLIQLRSAKWPMLIVISLFLIIAMVMPVFFLVMESFQIVPGGGYGANNLTLYAWIGELQNAPNPGYAQNGLFRNSEFVRALGNTVKLSLIASLITATFGQFFGYITTRGRGKWYGNAVEQLIFIPYLMPGVAFSAIYFSMFSQPRLGGLIPSLYGTFALILLVSIVKHFPFASRSGSSNMMQIAVELEEAATINGAGFWKRIASIIIPLAKNGFLSGFLLSFISIAKELDLIAILMTPKNYTLSFLAFDYSKEAMPQVADAICIVIIVFILVTNRIADKFGGNVSKSM